jgi:hypothetical protein
MALGLGSQSPIPASGQQELNGAVVPAQGIFEESSTQKHKLGQRLQLGERVYYYSYASEALAAGKVATAITKIFDEDTVTVAHPIGTKLVTITASAAIAAGELEEGYLVVDEGTDAGSVYRIKRNPAIANAATGVIELYDGLVRAWSTSDTDITIYTSIFKVQESNTDAVEAPVGVPNVAVTSANYFWLQTWGPCAVLMNGADGNAALERELVLSTAVAGAVMKQGADPGSSAVGSVLRDAADNEDAKYNLIFLRLVA